MASNWADLPQELLQKCSRCLCLKNLSAFRAVCHSWRSASVNQRSDVPWLMLSEQKEMLWLEYLCLLCQQVHKMLLPEVMAMMMANRSFSSRGWVLTISRDWGFQMLENPMLCYDHFITLPNWNNFPNLNVSLISKFVLSDSPTTSLDYKVMVIYGTGLLGLWKPGDEEWTAVTTPVDICDVIYYKGCFVAVDYEQRILRCDLDGPAPFEALVVFEMPERLQSFEQEYPSGYWLSMVEVYLVQSAIGSLLLVSRWEREGPTKTFLFCVYEIDLDTQTCTEVESLENSSLFLGNNSSFSLEVNENHLIKPNCIYFTDYSLSLLEYNEDGGDKNMGIYHLEDGTVESHVFKGKSPLLWIEPSF